MFEKKNCSICYYTAGQHGFCIYIKKTQLKLDGQRQWKMRFFVADDWHQAFHLSWHIWEKLRQDQMPIFGFWWTVFFFFFFFFWKGSYCRMHPLKLVGDDQRLSWNHKPDVVAKKKTASIHYITSCWWLWIQNVTFIQHIFQVYIVYIL